MSRTSDYPLVVIGAGAAGLGASAEATRLGVSHVVLEASHRIGGRALTEILDGRIPVDLGCHWMHCGSINPYVGLAKTLGFSYSTSRPVMLAHIGGGWQPESVTHRRDAAFERMTTLATFMHQTGGPASLQDCLIGNDQDAGWLNYWVGLMHSADPDQVSVSDIAEFHDTGEDWPVARGYGALIARAGRHAPVRLHCPLLVETPAGVIRTDRVLITVSTGVLNAGIMDFQPALPLWKQEAAAQLPLGNANYVFFALHDNALMQVPESIGYEKGENCAMVRIRPGGQDYAVAALGGRFAWWMEKQGEDAACQWFRDILADLFGNDAVSGLGRGKVSAWGFDPWTRGAYSARIPGAGDVRGKLAAPVDDRLWFAGEAASHNQFCTAHGAWINGRDAVSRMFECGGGEFPMDQDIRTGAGARA